ncbi:PREDICTED: neuroligin-4, X-linked-like [Branchiostoma belcheri]|uniref:Neuroligin-4, X-linked-like n=1 Tax=Branchiostoma belcheri TaxID=7741 RepID=A0A6P4Y135_BRABE|nr:PREDICTED: neuroligin-4, X-linked-like [Branchiostoma belcheri]
MGRRVTMGLLWFTLTAFMVAASAESYTWHVVSTKYGPVRGRRFPAPNYRMKSVTRYLGIPYAKPPVENLRFRPPQTPEPWVKMRDFDRPGPSCPQIVDGTNDTLTFPFAQRNILQPYTATMDEDCLYLNIYSPEISGPPDPNERYPLAVMVFVHGGGYTSGTGNAYDGTVLASHGLVVVVTINYRLGIFGFLSTGDKTAPGNYGLLDQIAALRWINENIGNFGGDPSRVTLFGIGAGAASVNLLTLSPLAAGLFRRVILHSGSALSTWSMANDPLRLVTTIAEKLDCCRVDVAQTVQCLRNKSYQKLLLKDVTLRAPASRFYSVFGPVVDGNVIPDEPRRLLEGDLFRSYDFMVGIAEDEGYTYVENLPDIEYGISENGYRAVVNYFVNQVFPYRENEITDAILFLYTNWGNNTNRTRRGGLVRLFTEQQVAVPLVEVANLHSVRNSESSTYMFAFNYRTNLSPYPDWVGACHGEELPLIFGASIAALGMFGHLNFTKGESMLSGAVMTYWSNFAKSGDPNKPQAQKTKFIHQRPNIYENLEWKRYSIENCPTCAENYLHLGLRPRLAQGFRSQRVAFWIDLVPKLLYPQAVPSNNYLYPDVEANGLCETLDIHQPGSGVSIARPGQGTKTTSIRKGTKCVTLPTPVVPSESTDNNIPSPVPDDQDWETPRESKRDTGNIYPQLSIVIAIGTALLVVNITVFVICFSKGKNQDSGNLENGHTRKRARQSVDDDHSSIKSNPSDHDSREKERSHKTEMIELKEQRSSKQSQLDPTNGFDSKTLVHL